MNDPNNKNAPVAVITGAAQGIGRRTAEVLGERGYRLALIDLKPSAETAAATKNSRAEVLEFTGDLTDEAFVNASAKTLIERWGAPQVVVNNAGISFIRKSEQ